MCARPRRTFLPSRVFIIATLKANFRFIIQLLFPLKGIIILLIYHLVRDRADRLSINNSYIEFTSIINTNYENLLCPKPFPHYSQLVSAIFYKKKKETSMNFIINQRDFTFIPQTSLSKFIQTLDRFFHFQNTLPHSKIYLATFRQFSLSSIEITTGDLGEEGR